MNHLKWDYVTFKNNTPFNKLKSIQFTKKPHLVVATVS